MIYLKDELTGIIRKFDEETPKGAKKVKGFLKARMYGVEESGLEVVGKRWKKSTKTAYTKSLKDNPIEVKEEE